MSNPAETPERVRRGPEPPDLSEKGGAKNGQPQRSDQRLFMQLLAFGGLVILAQGSAVAPFIYTLF